MVPSSIYRKVFCGWTNYSCKVTSHKITEKLMGNRGSKSDLRSKFNSVKEQRVDGSLCFYSKHIRYTLVGFERNYQVRIPSNQAKSIKHEGY